MKRKIPVTLKVLQKKRVTLMKILMRRMKPSRPESLSGKLLPPRQRAVRTTAVSKMSRRRYHRSYSLQGLTKGII